jgi:uncharacterized caspase-like protein
VRTGNCHCLLTGTLSAFMATMFHAVIIGIDHYADEKIHDLRFARADAEALANVLEDRVEGRRCITTLLDDEATTSRIAGLLTDELPRHVRENDEVLIFFAGHGSPEVEATYGEPSIHAVTHDTAYARLASTAIDMVTQLASWVRRLNTGHVALVIDASFNGAAGGRTFEGPGLWSGPRTRRLDRVSLNRLALGAQGVLVTACTDKEAAVEDPSCSHGVFTYHLLDQLRRAPDGPLDLATLYDCVASDVREATDGAQSPAFHGTRTARSLFRLGRKVGASRLASA